MDQNSCDFGEMTLYVRDHHVFDLKLGNRMSCVDVPGGGACGGLRNGHCAHRCFSFHFVRCVTTIFVATTIVQKIRPLWLEPLPASPAIPSVELPQGGQVVYGASPAQVRQDG